MASILRAGVVLKVNTVWRTVRIWLMRKSARITVRTRLLEEEFLAYRCFVGVVNIPTTIPFADTYKKVSLSHEGGADLEDHRPKSPVQIPVAVNAAHGVSGVEIVGFSLWLTSATGGPVGVSW